MNNNRVIKGLLVALILNCAATPLQADWLAPIRNFFNNPTKEKLIVSCALAGISLLTAGTAFYCYRGLGKLYEQQRKEKEALEDDNATLFTMNSELETKITEMREKATSIAQLLKREHETCIAEIEETRTQIQSYSARFNAMIGACFCHQQPHSANRATHAAASPRAADISGFGSEQLSPREETGTLGRFNAEQIYEVEARAQHIFNTARAGHENQDEQRTTPSSAATGNNNSSSAQGRSPLQDLKDQVDALAEEMAKEGGYRASPSTSPKNSNLSN